MERAGRAVAAHALEDFGNARSFTVVCGSGSNGGDGKVAARVLEEAGRHVLVVDAKPEDEEKDLGDPDVLVDALFGTGFEGEPRPGAARLIEQMNDLGAPILSVDLPSGVDASTGEVAGAAVDADLTVTFHGAKVGHYVTPGAYLAGYLEVVDIGLEHVKTENARVTREILDRVPRRSPEGQQVQVGARRGRRRLARDDRRALPLGDCGVSRGCRLRRRSQAPSRRCPSSSAGCLEAVKRGLPADGDGLVTEGGCGPCSRARGQGRISRRRARARTEPGHEGVRAPAARRGAAPDRRRRRRALGARARRLARAASAHAPFRGARPLLGEEATWVDAHRLRGGSARRGSVRVRRPAQRGRKLDRGSRQGRASSTVAHRSSPRPARETS